MKDLSPDDRPREKLLRHGAAALGDNELVAVVLGSGRRARRRARRRQRFAARARRPARPGAIARAAIWRRSPASALAKAAKLVAAQELGRRTLAVAPPARVRLATPRDSAALLLPAFGSRPVEHFGVVLLDTKHRVIRTTVVAIGTLNSTVVEPRDVFREAMLGAAAAVVVFHNHPSGDPSPSPDDIALTRRLAAVGELIGIPVVDHIVLGDARYCSLKEMGEL